MTKTKILIVGDERLAVDALEEQLECFGYAVCAISSPDQQALEKATARHPDVALVALGLAGEMDGPEVADQMGERFDIPVIYLTANEGEDLLRRAECTRPFGYVVKPFDARQVHLTVQTALRRHQREHKLQQIIDELNEQNEVYEFIFDSIADAVIVVENERRPGSGTPALIFNSKAEQILGIGATDTEPDEWPEKYGLFFPDQVTPIPPEKQALVRAMHGKPTDEAEMFVRNHLRPDGLFIRGSARPLLSAAGEIIGGVVVFRDVTAEKEAERKLRETVDTLQRQTQLMQVVFDNMEEGVVMADMAGNFLLANRRREEIIGKKLLALEPSAWPATFGAFYLDKETRFPTDELPIVRAMRGEATEDVELFIRNENRPEGVYVRARGRPLFDSNQNVVAGVAIFSDITKYKQAEAELEHTIHHLRSQTQLMETVFESIGDGVVAADSQGRFTIFNPSAERIVGMGMMESSPENWTSQYGIFHADGQTPFRTDQLPLLRAMRGKTTDDMEVLIRNEKRPAGVFISVNGRPLLEAAEGHEGGVITFRDITIRKKAERDLNRAMQELRDQSELMEAAFTGISDGLVVADSNGELLNVNPAAQHIVGIDMAKSPQAKVGAQWGTSYYTDRETRIKTEDLPLYRAVFRGESTDEMDVFIRNSRKPIGIFIRTSARPLLHSDGSIRGGVAIFRDVTAQVQAEEALARAFTQGRLEIIDTILHNVGNAINSVTTGIDTLRRHLVHDPLLPRLHALADAVKAHQDNWADYVAHDPQGQKVMPFIMALAEDFARQRNGMMKTTTRVRDRANHIADIVRNQKVLDGPRMDRKDLDLRDALSAAVRVLRESLRKRGIRVEIQCSDAPREIRIQESQFHQMMINLVKNSIEAFDGLAASSGVEEKPRICIRAYTEGDFLHLDVMDNGIGISTRNTKILFTAGYTTKPSGSGLGLHSVANFVIGSGGQVHALSDGLGKGTTLRVMLRLSAITPPPEKLRAPRGEAGKSDDETLPKASKNRPASWLPPDSGGREDERGASERPRVPRDKNA